MRDLGRFIRDRRTECGFSVREFARRLDRSAAYVSRLEVRGEIPSAPLACEMARVLNVSLDDLLAQVKEAQLERASREIDQRHAEALILHRKERKTR